MNLASGIRGLRPEKLFSIQVFVISLLWMALLHFLDIQNNIGFTNPIQRMLVLFIAHAITFSLLLAPYFLLRNKLSQKSLTLLLVIAVVVVSPVRGFAFFYLLRAVVGRDAAPLALRVSGSLTNLSFAIIVAWIGISAVETHRIGRQRLIE